MILDIHTSPVTGQVCFVEVNYFDAHDLIELLWSCGFRNARIGCWSNIDNCIVFEKEN